MPQRKCPVLGCEGRVGYPRVLCREHLARWQAHGVFALPVTLDPERCSVHVCPNPVQARGMCRLHYKRWDALGIAYETPTDEERFWAKTDVNGPVPDYAPHLGPCWLWKSSAVSGRYGRFKLEAGEVGAHRWSYERFIGAIPDGLEIDHLCRVPACVNPAHLEAVTTSENQLRGLAPLKLRKIGEENPVAKLNVDAVRQIRALSEQGVGNVALGRRFGVSRRNIQNVVNRDTWTHI